MLRLFSASAGITTSLNFVKNSQIVFNNVVRPQYFTRNFFAIPSSNNYNGNNSLLLQNPAVSQISNNIINRNLTKFSYTTGKRKTVKTVLRRFYRLHWGGWIRTMCGRSKKLWKKSPPRKRRLRQHVICNATQSTLLDKMVTPYWRRPKYYVDDPYEPYHTREEFVTTYRKPRPYFPPEN